MSGKKDYQTRVQTFEIIYGLYKDKIELYLVMRGHRREIACDLCQETFERFWKFLLSQETTSQQTANYKNWLYKTAKNLAIDNHRHEKVIDFQPLPDSEAYAQFAELMVEGEEDRIYDLIWLQDEVPQLSEKYRECLLRKHYWGYTQKEIAAELGISESAVSANVSRGKTHLHRKYFPVTADIKRVLEGMDIELLVKAVKEYTRQQIHRELMDGTSWERLDEFSELCSLYDRRYTREQVRYLDEEQFIKEEPHRSTTCEIAFPVYNDTSALLFVRPSELLIVRGGKIITAS